MQSFFSGDLVRNPATKNSGKFVTLTEFLELAKTKEVPGVLISINVIRSPYSFLHFYAKEFYFTTHSLNTNFL